MSFAQRLHALRKERGLTQRALAEASETHLTQIQRYESGETQPTLTALRKIAVALNVTTDTLVFEAGERELTTGSSSLKRSRSLTIKSARSLRLSLTGLSCAIQRTAFLRWDNNSGRLLL